VATLNQKETRDKNTLKRSVTTNAKVLSLFADTLRLLENFRTFATPCSKTQLALRYKRKWEVPHGTKFPVAFYDKRRKLIVAESESELKKSLKKLLGVCEVLLHEVPTGARFVWVEFEWGKKPTLLNPKVNRPLVLDQHALERVEKTIRLLFPDVPKLRLAFSVSADNRFKLMEGVIVGYR
jgi:hypothetical protein